MIGGAHSQLLLRDTAKSKPREIPIDSIASTGFPLHQYADVEKVQRMQRSYRKTGKLKPVRVVRLTPELRDKYGVTDPDKEFYMPNGHHRLAAAKLEGATKIRAVDAMTGRRL